MIPSFKAFLIESNNSRPKQWTAYHVIKNILRGKAWDPAHEQQKDLKKVSYKSDEAVDIHNADYEEKAPKGAYWVSRPWSSSMKQGMFSHMDLKPGEGGAIGLPNPHGTSGEDLAAAAHEAFHALAHQAGGNHADEQFANDNAEKWLKANLTGAILTAALKHIEMSRKHYG
jgi:hypothetical protein